MKPYLQCAEQEVSRSNLTKYCACHAERLAYLVLITYETSFTMRGATGVTIQPHQILRLSRRKTHILSPHHIWNVIYSAPSNRCHDPTSPNTAPATQNWIAKFLTKSLKTDETSFPMRGRSDHDPRMIRPWSEHDPRMKTQTATRLATEVTFRPHHEHFLLKNTTFRAQSYIQTFTKYCACHEKSHLNVTKYCACHEKWHLNFTKYCACHEKWHLNFTKYCTCHEKWHLNFTKYCTCHEKWLDCCIVLTYETSFTMRGATGVTIQPHQILRLPRKIELQNFWQNLWKQMKRHFQCGADPTMIREWSDHDPSMIREWKRKPQPASQPRLLFDLTTSIFYWKIQRFAPNLTFKPSPNTAPATKSHTWTSPSTAPATKSDTWTSPSTAPATKNDIWTSPNTAPATKNDTWTSPNTAPATKNDSTALLYLTLLYLTLLYLTLLYLTYSTWFYSTWLYSTWLYSTWLYSTWHYSTWLYSTWLYSTWLYSTWHYSTWLYSTWLYSTWLYSTWHYSTWLYSTWLYSTWLYSTWLYSTWLYSTWLYSTWL